MSNIFSQHKQGSAILIMASAGLALVMGRHQPLPNSVVLDVPFTDQAPTGKWDRNEDCEETSIVMARAYLTGDTSDIVPPAEAQESITALKQWEAANIGYNANTGAYATSHMAEGAFSLKVDQIKDYTADDLKQALVDHHVILLPINARLLGNPTYAESGPLYHMIVVRGYTTDGFVVNDPGTVNGDANIYSFDTLHNAAADWNQQAKILDPTIKIALILSK